MTKLKFMAIIFYYNGKIQIEKMKKNVPGEVCYHILVVLSLKNHFFSIF